MKKLLLASAVAALSVTAQAAPTVYGKAFLTLDYEKDGRTQLNSNGSRIGFKGADPISTNTDVVYQLEYNVKVDDGTVNFTARDTYIGVKNKQLGTLLAGRLSAIDGNVDYANVTAGGIADGVLTSFDGNRANNALAYVSPSYNGLNFMGMYVLDEFVGAEYDAMGKRLEDNESTDTFAGDVFGVGVAFEPDNAPYKAGATYIQRGDRKITRVSGAFDVSPAVTVGALYQNDTINKNSEKENAFVVSGTLKTTTPWTAYGQLDLVSNKGGVKDAEEKRFAFGGKYAFNKSATGHLYGSIKDAGGSENQYGIGGGLEYKF